MHLMHSCKRVAELLSQSQDEPLSWIDRVRMRVHLPMCDNYRNVEQQIFGMEALTRDLFCADASLDDEAIAASTGAARPTRPAP